MATNEYHFITRWRVKATVQEVTDVLRDPTDLPRWWPSVYLDAKRIEPGDERGVGQVVELYTKGWLPYTLRWHFRVTEVGERSTTLQAFGDFEGYGKWTFEQEGDWANITYDWHILANKPILRRLSFLMKPLFGANHRWAMAKGEESLKLELARRRARTPEEKAQIPPPPGATLTWFVRRSDERGDRSA